MEKCSLEKREFNHEHCLSYFAVVVVVIVFFFLFIDHYKHSKYLGKECNRGQCLSHNFLGLRPRFVVVSEIW